MTSSSARVHDLPWAPSFRLAFRFVPPIAAALLLLAVWRFHDPETGFTSLVRFGDRFAARALPAVKAVPHHVEPRSAGYDGQFYAQMATDPLLRDPALDRAVDEAPLRARRIFFVWTAWLLGLGQPRWILQAYALQNVLAWLGLAALLVRWFPPTTLRSTALWLGSAFTGGLIWSVAYALLDGPSLLLLVVGMAALEAKRGWVSALVFGIAGLGRETNLLSVTAQFDPTRRTWRALARQALQLLVVVAPFVLWFDYIYSIYRSLVFTSGGTLTRPFAYYTWKWQMALNDVAGGWTPAGLVSLLALVAITVQAAYVVARPAWRDAWWRLAIGYVALLPFLGRSLWEGSPGTAERVLVPMALAFNVLLRRCEPATLFWPLFVAGNLTVVHALVLLGAFGGTP